MSGPNSLSRWLRSFGNILGRSFALLRSRGIFGWPRLLVMGSPRSLMMSGRAGRRVIYGWRKRFWTGRWGRWLRWKRPRLRHRNLGRRLRLMDMNICVYRYISRGKSQIREVKRHRENSLRGQLEIAEIHGVLRLRGALLRTLRYAQDDRVTRG